MSKPQVSHVSKTEEALVSDMTGVSTDELRDKGMPEIGAPSARDYNATIDAEVAAGNATLTPDDADTDTAALTGGKVDPEIAAEIEAGNGDEDDDSDDESDDEIY